MKTIVLFITLISFSFQAYSTCYQDYSTELSIQVEKLNKFAKISKLTTISGATGMAIFWDVMGVILVGPAGLIIGTQFGLIAAVGVGAPLYGAYVLKRKNAEKVGIILQMIEELNSSEKPELTKLLQFLQKKKVDFTMPELVEKITVLNNSRALCNGNLTNSDHRLLATPKDLKKYLRK